MTARLLILVVVVVLMLSALPAQAYVSTQVPHDDGIYSDYDLCAMCHTMLYDPGIAGEVTYQFRDSASEFISYRCAACHIGINTTSGLTSLHGGSIHAGLSCTSCHDVYHAGHSFRRGYYYLYDTVQVYGCGDTRACHQVTGNWPSSPLPPGTTAYNFAPVHYVNETASKSWRITRILFGYGLTYSTAVYPESFLDQYNGSLSSVPQTLPTRMCHKCHFTAPNAPTTTPQQYQYTHPEQCTLCHSPTGDVHGVEQAQASWGQCQTCHQTIAANVAASVHQAVGCRCHVVVHAAGWNRTGSWMPLYYPPTGRLITGDPASLPDWRHLFYYSTQNYTTYLMPPGLVTDGATETYVYIAYTLRYDATPINQTSRLATCFNCHFTSWDEAGQASIFLALGDWNGDPHSVPPPTGESPSGERTGSGVGVERMALSALLAGAAIAIIMLAGWKR